MKKICLLLTVIFTFSLCLASIPGDVLAKSENKDVKTTTSKKTDKASEKSKKSTVSNKKSKSSTSKKKTTKDIPTNVNINSASKDQLTQLPGVGPVTAEAIMKYRKANGNFKSINDLTKVKGIGDKTLSKLKPYLKKI